MSEESDIERLKTTPISELNLGNVALRRAIKRAGFNTLPEILRLSEKEIDDIFDLKVADSIIGMQEKYLADPASFAARVLQKRVIDKAAAEKVLSDTKQFTRSTAHRSTKSMRVYIPGDGPANLPTTPFANALRSFEKRAREIFDELDDMYEDVMVYQAFEEFSTELNDLSNAFGGLFDFYQGQPRIALNLIDKHLRNAFIVYVADRARVVYDGSNLWGNFFNGLGIQDSNVQSLLKQIFVEHIERRDMPLYAQDEEANYYFYTALLHGGLSADSWANLWDKSILPLAAEIAKGKLGFGGAMDGHAILKELKNPDSRFAPKKTVLNILEKAPDSTIAPLFEASMQVASQVEGSKNARNDYTMLSSFGLPEAAMEALRDSQEQSDSVTRAHGTGSAKRNSQDRRRLIYLPQASLQLDLAKGIVTMRWPRQQFPLHFAGSRIDYYVDGKLELSSKFEVSVGKCILEAVSIEVKPQSRYDVELRLMQKDSRSEEYVEASSLSQTFTRNKPGCFEFIKDQKGFYRLRGKNEKITRKRRIAYIVKEGCRIDPGLGMSPVSIYETSGDWDNTQIFIYDVEPGASGAVFNALTGGEIAVWQERYSAKIDKSRVIGETVNGIDLYGYVPCGLGTNGGLPSVTIEAIDGQSALDDLDITCTCDGQRVSIPRHLVWADNYGKSNAAQIALVPQESSLFDWHIEECLIEARQKSAAGKVVFRYKFAVIPIQDFRPTSIDFDYGIAIAEYGFQALTEIEVEDSQGDAATVNAWGRYQAKTLLKDDFLYLRIRSKVAGKETAVKLALAAIEVDIPTVLSKRSKNRPICLADVLELGPSAANFKVTSFGWRRNRAIIAWLGDVPLYLIQLKRPGEHSFNLFRHPSLFVQCDESPAQERLVKITLIYGDDIAQDYLRPAWSDIRLVRCAEGVGVKGWKLLMTNEGKHVIRFDGEPLCDVHFTFKRKIGGRVVAEEDVEAGARELVLPGVVTRLLDTQKKILAEVSPTDWLGKPMLEYSTEFTLTR